MALRPEVLAFHRLFIAEAPRFPGLAKLFVERNRHRPLSEIIRVLAVYADRGVIQFGDLELLAEQFFILVAGVPQRLALFGGREESLAGRPQARSRGSLVPGWVPEGLTARARSPARIAAPCARTIGALRGPPMHARSR